MSTAALPWYRIPTVWLLIALPATAVLAGFATLWIAASTDDGVVNDDYYRRGKEINRELRRDRAAAARDLRATLYLDAVGKELRIVFARGTAPAQLQAQFLHATRGDNDRQLLLAPDERGVYRAPLPPLAPGRYHLQLAADDWRLVGSLRAPQDARAELAPGSER
jgi:hypothetical protein